MISDLIYKRDSQGRIRTWQFEVSGDRFRTHAGLMDGEKVCSAWTVCTPKSQDTAEAQALFEAHADQKKKLERDYRPSLAEVDRPRGSGVRPMLAQKYEGWAGPCYSQVKLDGIRCLANKHGLWSRQDKPITAAPHVHAGLAHVFNAFPEAIVDGELYNHGLKDDFNKITSVVRKSKLTEKDLAESASLIQYHIYDIVAGPEDRARFKDRLAFMHAVVDFDVWGPLLYVATNKVYNEDALDQLYAQYLERGYEGQIIRYDQPYDQKRSPWLLKRKEFQDAEYDVIRLEEGLGNWAGYAKRAVLRLPDGREFGAGIKGNQVYTRALLGKEFKSATVRYFALTPDGVPRFPVAVSFHDGDRM